MVSKPKPLHRTLNLTRALAGWTLAIAMLLFPVVGGSLTISYAYDPAGRLLGADYGGNQTVSYAYDAAGNLVEADAPAPSLATALTADGRHVVITWPVFPTDFVLETTLQLGPGAQWEAADAPVVQTGDQFSATVPLGSTGFYRLRNP